MQTGSNTTVWREHGGVVTGFLSHPLKLHFNWRISNKKTNQNKRNLYRGLSREQSEGERQMRGR